eukprot:Nk52_evm14s1224 gene=Nk52_evmTU14s1224
MGKGTYRQFYCRTVEATKNGVDRALKVLRNDMTEDKSIRNIRSKRVFIKPWITRRNKAYSEATNIYQRGMKEKLDFAFYLKR